MNGYNQYKVRDNFSHDPIPSFCLLSDSSTTDTSRMTGYTGLPEDPPRIGRQLGFSLIEIMVVVVIMGIMAALIVPNVMDRPDQARAVAARQDIAAIMQALKLYRLDNGRYPSTEQGLQVLSSGEKSTNAAARSYLDQLPNDPWGAPYLYLNPGVHGEIDVFTLGADRRAGGESSNADVGSWSR